MGRTSILAVTLSLAGCTLFGDPETVVVRADSGPTADRGPSVDPDPTGDAQVGDVGARREECDGEELVDASSPDALVGDGTPESCDEDALRAALAVGGIVGFNCGGADHEIVLTEPLKVEQDIAFDGGGTITLSGGGSSRIFVIDTLTASPFPVLRLQRIRLVDGYAQLPERPCGAAVFKRGGTFIGVDVEFAGHECQTTADGEFSIGGAVFAEKGDGVRLNRAVFTNNRGGFGGAVGGVNHEVRVDNSRFIGNSATKSGGALEAVGGTITTCGSTFRSNTAGAEGGAISFTSTSWREPRVEIHESAFAQNDADADGGAVYVYGAAVVIKRSWFDGNESGSAGGVRLQAGEIDVENCTFHGNVARGEPGGGMYLADVTGTLRHLTLVENKALATGSFGGAIHGGSGLVLSNSVFADNFGGNVYEDQSCSEVMTDGGGNIQFPRKRPSDQEDGPCASDVLFADPLLEPFDGDVGAVFPRAESPALGYAMECPPRDQLGEPRSESRCTSGAVEAE